MHGFFDTDLHEVSWHFATHEVVMPSGFYVQVTERSEVSSPGELNLDPTWHKGLMDGKISTDLVKINVKYPIQMGL